VVEIVDEVNSESLIEDLKDKGIWVVGFGKQKIRMVTHLDFDDEMLDELVGRL
jgi:threonine aldolase